MRFLKAFCAVLVALVLLFGPSIGVVAQESVTANMKLSAEGAAFIKKLEGFHAKPYFDSGGWAVGYGSHTWNRWKVTKTYPGSVTQAEADELFPGQVVRYEDIVKSSVGDVLLTQNSFDALVSVAYNLGHINRDILQKFAASREVTLRDFLSTATVHNRPHKLLVKRRTVEYQLFREPDLRPQTE